MSYVLEDTNRVTGSELLENLTKFLESQPTNEKSETIQTLMNLQSFLNGQTLSNGNVNEEEEKGVSTIIDSSDEEDED